MTSLDCISTDVSGVITGKGCRNNSKRRVFGLSSPLAIFRVVIETMSSLKTLTKNGIDLTSSRQTSRKFSTKKAKVRRRQI